MWKRDIRLDLFGAARRSFWMPSIAAPSVSSSRLRGALRRARRRGRLDDLAHLEKRVNELFGRILVDLPAQDVRIEHVPVDHRPHARADLRPRHRQPLGRQNPHRLAHGRPRNAELGLDLRLGRQRLAREDTGRRQSGGRSRQPPSPTAARSRPSPVTAATARNKSPSQATPLHSSPRRPRLSASLPPSPNRSFWTARHRSTVDGLHLRSCLTLGVLPDAP